MKNGKAGRVRSGLLDTSALVPLCVRQGITPRAITLYKTHDAVASWATPVEIASALARLVRMAQLDSIDWTKAVNLQKGWPTRGP